MWMRIGDYVKFTLPPKVILSLCPMQMQIFIQAKKKYFKAQQ